MKTWIIKCYEGSNVLLFVDANNINFCRFISMSFHLKNTEIYFWNSLQVMLKNCSFQTSVCQHCTVQYTMQSSLILYINTQEVKITMVSITALHFLSFFVAFSLPALLLVYIYICPRHVLWCYVFLYYCLISFLSYLLILSLSVWSCIN
jgi:hypothetical protein